MFFGKIVISYRKEMRLIMANLKNAEKKIKQITSYLTDARHDLTASTLGKSMKTNIAPRGVTTLVIDF